MMARPGGRRGGLFPTMDDLHIISEDRDVLITVKVVPGSSRTAIAGVLGGLLKVKIAAPPERGRANTMLAALLARRLGVGRQDVEILSGHTGPVKQVRIAGVTADAVRDLLRT